MFKSLFKKNKEPKDTILVAPLTGTVVPLEDVPDKVFAEKMMGDGLAIKPTDNKVVSPLDGEVVDVFNTKHAISFRSNEGVELLIHMGLETVNLKGEGFDIKVSAGQKVKQGDVLADFNLEQINNSGYNTITPIIVLNGDDFEIAESNTSGTVSAGEQVIAKVISKE
ncbi:PTS sugar transporter subunit IIA [Aquibacillus kalidii]|uniref:PTS sugar transporter subunit IIA n=1 Tax=Aquibacillus kalidii TaxID=2762597 RepID=UPI001646192D|nr:PTS glucose transporter subunit IIA [Aquibacillus kalidii]